MRKIHFYGLIISHFLARWKGKILARPVIRKRYVLLVFMTILAFIIGLRVLYLVLTKQTLSQGIVGVYTVDNLPTTVTNLLSSPLITLDKSGQPQPSLAKSWQINNNATQYTFTLNDNLFWSDGSKLKASDLVFSLPNINVGYPDDQTIIFQIPESYSPLTSLLTDPVFKANSLIGLGPYKIDSIQYDRGDVVVTRLVLEARQVDLPALTIRFYQDEDTAKTAFSIGEIQSVIGLKDLLGIRQTAVVKVKGFTDFQQLVAIFYNTKDPTLSDKNLRKALGYATPKLANEEYAKTSIPSYSWAFNNSVRDFLGHSDQAKGFLEKAKLSKEPIILTAPPTLTAQAELIIQGWKSIGVPAVVRIESGKPQNFQAALFVEPILEDPDQYALWHSTQSTNISHYKSDRVDKDLEDGRKTSDLQIRKERYMDMQKVLADDSPATFLYFAQSYAVYLAKSEANLFKVLSRQFVVN